MKAAELRIENWLALRPDIELHAVDLNMFFNIKYFIFIISMITYFEYIKMENNETNICIPTICHNKILALCHKYLRFSFK